MAINPDFRVKLDRRPYRQAFLRETLKGWIVHQIKALRDAKDWKQAQLGEAMGKPQPVVARIENPDYGKWNFNTLVELANAFDVALEVRFTDWASFCSRAQSIGSQLEVADYASTDWGLLDGRVETASSQEIHFISNINNMPRPLPMLQHVRSLETVMPCFPKEGQNTGSSESVAMTQ